MTDDLAAEGMVTYKRADGEMVLDEYGWVTDLEWFDPMDLETPVELVKETWTLTSRETVIVKPHDWCDEHNSGLWVCEENHDD